MKVRFKFKALDRVENPRVALENIGYFEIDHHYNRVTGTSTERYRREWRVFERDLPNAGGTGNYTERIKIYDDSMEAAKSRGDVGVCAFPLDELELLDNIGYQLHAEHIRHTGQTIGDWTD
jgi:hypothetical protein